MRAGASLDAQGCKSPRVLCVHRLQWLGTVLLDVGLDVCCRSGLLLAPFNVFCPTVLSLFPAMLSAFCIHCDCRVSHKIDAHESIRADKVFNIRMALGIETGNI